MARYESDTADAEFVVKVLTDFVNNNQNHKKFADCLAGQHRTLQQGVTRLFMDWMRLAAADVHYDLRNEATVLLARKMRDTPEENDFSLPHV